MDIFPLIQQKTFYAYSYTGVHITVVLLGVCFPLYYVILHRYASLLNFITVNGLIH